MDEGIKLEKNELLLLKKIKKDIKMTKEDEEDFKHIKICRFRERSVICDKIRDHWLLTCIYRGPVNNKCDKNVREKKTNFSPFVFHKFGIYHCRLFFKKLLDK